MSMALEVVKIIFVVLDVSFVSVIIKRQCLNINICSFSIIFIYVLALVHYFVRTKC